MTRTLATAGLAATLAALAAAAPAAATEVVDDDKAQCPSAAHTTIQGGVNAASPGETVLVCNGTYQETVSVAGSSKDGVQIVANATQRATIQAPRDYSGPIVQIAGADRVQVRRFVIDGPFSASDNSCPPTGLNSGVQVIFGSVGAVIKDNAIVGINDGHAGTCDTGENIAVDVQNGGRATIGYNQIVHYQDLGVRVVGPGSFVLVDHNSIIAGPGQFDQQGVAISGGAQANVTTNQISENGFDNAGFGQGIQLVGADDENVRITGNRLFRNDVGLLVALQTGAQIINNFAFDNNEHGVDMRPDTVNNKLERNAFRGNGGLDCEDRTAGSNPTTRGFPRYTTRNLWVNNKGLDASPPQICTPTGEAGPPVP